MNKSKMKDIPDSSVTPSSGKRIDLGRLKAFVLEKLPPDSTLREVILTEADSLTPEEFIVNVKMWQKLLKKESSEDRIN